MSLTPTSPELTITSIDAVSASLHHDIIETQSNDKVDFKLSTKAFRNIYSATTTDVIPFIEKHMQTYGINTKRRMSVFLSACFIMSVGFRRCAEGYNISPCRLFKEYDKVDSYKLATQLVRNGEREIANFLFSFELGNGGIDSNDGWMFRARTPLQFRGRDLYQAISDRTGIDCINNPELLEDPENSIIAAMAFWQTKGYNELTDKLKFANAFELTTRARKNSDTKDYRSNSMALTMKKKLTNDSASLVDFCEFIEMGMLYL